MRLLMMDFNRFYGKSRYELERGWLVLPTSRSTFANFCRIFMRCG
jgi:hypothetical protein